MKLIELTGIPGSGKSLFSRVIKDFFDQWGQNIYGSKAVVRLYMIKNYRLIFLRYLPVSIGQRIAMSLFRFTKAQSQFQLQFIFNNLDLFTYVTNLIQNRLMPSQHKHLILNNFIRVGGLFEMAKAILDEDSYFVLEEGFLQKVVGLFVSIDGEAPGKEKLKGYLELVPEPQYLFEFTTDLNVSIDRMRKRGRLPVRLKDRPVKEIIEFLNKSLVVVGLTSDYCITQGVSVIKINNSMDYNTAKERDDYALNEIKNAFKDI